MKKNPGERIFTKREYIKMSRGTSKPQNESSSDWLQEKLNELRRLIQENKAWPETGAQLIKDLSYLTTSPPQTSPEEENEMLSIVVNDALIGIDIMKKYPTFYARMLVDEELRSAFLDTLELLEQSQAGELSDYSGQETIDLGLLRKVMSLPIVERSPMDKIVMVWKRTVEQLQNMFYLASLQPKEVLRSGGAELDSGPINVLKSQVEVDGQEYEIRLDALQTITTPELFDLMITVFTPEESERRFGVNLAWGDYQGSAELNRYGIAKFPPIQTDQIFTPEGELMHGLELRLEQVN